MKVYAQTNDDVGVWVDKDCLLNNSCTFSYNKAIGVRNEISDPESNTLKWIVQDGFLAATFFIGTVCVAAIIWSGFKMITAGGADDGAYDQWKKGIKYSVIWLVLVVMSYTIIRIIQFIAQWNQ